MKRRLSFVTAFTIAAFSLPAFSSSIINAEEKEPTEIISLRSEYGKQFDNGDGTITSYINTVPIHYWDNDEWVEIDNSLILDENGNYINKCSSLDITIPSIITISNDLSAYDPNIQLEYNGYKLSISLEQILDNNPNEYVEATLIDKNADVGVRENIPHGMKDSFEKVVSSVEYDSICDGTDLFMDIRPDSFCESFYYEKDSVIPDSLTFFVNADGLLAKQNENNEITFEDSSGNSVFTIPVPIITDSSCESMGVPVDVDITENNNGYYISFYPNEPANEIEDPVYPLILSTEYSVQRSANTRYNSENSPYGIIYDQYMRIGNIDGNGFQTFVSCNDLFNGYSGNVTITDATFNMYLVGNYLSSQKNLKVYSLNTQPMNCSWNNASTLTNYNTSITDFNVVYTEMYTWKEVDIKELVQSWLNYGKTSQNIGVAPYGFKIITDSTPQATVVAYSERASYNHPYFEIDYIVDSDYSLTYAPYKYDNIDPPNENYGKIYNFQRRMNCYAYALQMYYRASGDYHLKPGEFGILQRSPSQNYIDIYGRTHYIYNYTNYNQLEGGYECFEQAYEENINNSNLNTVKNAFTNFVEEQMYKDAQQIGFSIINFGRGSNTFSLPNDFNENQERIIAMITYHYDGFADDYMDYHYYLRNGNGTCNNPNHGSNCSIWSHKNSMGKVQKTCYAQNYSDVVLCDNNIGFYCRIMSSLANSPYDMCDATRFYRITKTTDAYNAWFYDGHNSANTTGTSFVYLD